MPASPAFAHHPHLLEVFDDLVALLNVLGAQLAVDDVQVCSQGQRSRRRQSGSPASKLWLQAG
jgi:hypothetical protein